MHIGLLCRIRFVDRKKEGENTDQTGIKSHKQVNLFFLPAEAANAMLHKGQVFQ
jgi:hypothetical protein